MILAEKDKKVLLRNSSLKLIFIVGLCLFIGSACKDQGEPSHEDSLDLSEVKRFTAELSEIRGDPGLLSLSNLDYDLFKAQTDPLLDETFVDLEPWKDVGEENKENPAFVKIALAGCSGDSALDLKPGAPNKGRLVRLKSLVPLTVLARVKLPVDARLEEIEDLLCLAEIKRRTKLGLRAVTPDQFLSVHNQWRRTGQSGEWTEIFQVFNPKGNARFLLVGFNGSSPFFKHHDHLRVDRIVIRSATVAESATAVIEGLSKGSDPGKAPLMRCEFSGELRDALVTATPGTLSLPLEAGPERIFRFGLAFPTAESHGHSKEIGISVKIAQGEAQEIALHQEIVQWDAPPEEQTGWLERRIKIPPLEQSARLLLKSETADGGDGIIAWGAPVLIRPTPEKTEKNRPSIILVSIDTLRADRLGPYGGSHPEGISPFMDRIARESILFENAIAQAPFTLPSHVSMLSGQYPSVHRVVNKDCRISTSRTPLLAPMLARAGYLTGAFTGGLLVQHTFGFDAGFDTYFEKEPCKKDHLSRVMKWMEANQDLPFFLFFHTYAVHHCAFDDPEYINRFDPDCPSAIHNFSSAPEWSEWLNSADRHTPADQRCLDNRYAAGIRMADDALEKLLSSLERSGTLDHTLLVITSDHGKELLDRGNIQHGHTLYEELIRVPLIIRPPGGSMPRRIPDLVEVLDIPPTLLDWLGLPIPPAVQGRSLAGLMDSLDTPSTQHLAFSEVDSTSHKYALRTKDWKIIYNPPREEPSVDQKKEYELYHLLSDPKEKTDLAPGSGKFKAFRDRMILFRKNLQSLSAALKDEGGSIEEIDPELLEELRAHGYVQ